MRSDADIAFTTSTVGLVLHFVLTDPPVSAGEVIGLPISNATSATVTWVAQDGRLRPLTLNVAASADFTYQVTLQDSRMPHVEQGYLLVSFGTNQFMTSTFVTRVFPHF